MLQEKRQFLQPVLSNDEGQKLSWQKHLIIMNDGRLCRESNRIHCFAGLQLMAVFIALNYWDTFHS